MKEQLRATPHNGIGYGVLRYLNAEAGDWFKKQDEAQIVFNYLGQFDQAATNEGKFGRTGAATGAQRSQRDQRPYLFEVISLVRDGQLHIEWIYSDKRHRQQTVEALASRYRSALETLIERCRAPGVGGYTPSDFPLASLSQQQLDQVLGGKHGNVEDIYPLSPMQKSIYLFGLQHPHSGIGVEQMSFCLRGNLNQDAFWQA